MNDGDRVSIQSAFVKKGNLKKKLNTSAVFLPFGKTNKKGQQPSKKKKN